MAKSPWEEFFNVVTTGAKLVNPFEWGGEMIRPKAPPAQAAAAPPPQVQAQPQRATQAPDDFWQPMKDALGQGVNAIRGVGEGIAAPYKQLSEGVAETAAYDTPEKKSARAATLSLQDTYAKNLKLAGDRLRDPSLTPEQRARWQKYAEATAKESGQQFQADTAQNNQIIERTDPVKGAASVASIGFDVATAGMATAGTQAAKQAAQQGGRTALTKELLRQGAKSGALAAPSGALSPVIEKGAEATPGDIAAGAATGALIGSVLPTAAYGGRKVIDTGQNSLVKILGKDTVEALDGNVKVKPTADRPAGNLQLAIEEANARGDTVKVRELVEKLPNDVKAGVKSALGIDDGTQVAVRDGKIVRIKRPVPATNATPPATNIDPNAPKTTSDLTDQILRDVAGIDPAAGAPKVRIINKAIKAVTGFPTLGEAYKSGVVDPIRDKINQAIYKGVSSTNKATAAISQAPRVVGANIGLTDDQRMIMRVRNDVQSNAGRVLREVNSDLGNKMKAAGDPAEVNKRLYQFFEQPDFLARKFGDGTPKITYEDLSPQEREIADALISVNKIRNDVNLETGLITPEMHDQFKDGMHSPRIYDLEAKNKGSDLYAGTNQVIDRNAAKKRVDVNTVDDEIFGQVLDSPVQSMLIRAEVALRNKASFDALKGLQDAGLMFDTAPNKGFSELVGKKYGAFQGKYIDNQLKSELDGSQIFNTKAGEKVNDLLDVYRGSIAGKADRTLKSFKTTISPATGLGNIMSNILFFNRGAGSSSIVQSGRMAKAAADLIADSTGKFNRDIYEARKFGVFSENTGKAINGVNTPELTSTTSVTKNPYKIAQNVYGGVDDAAKLAIWRNLRAKGLAPEKAAKRVAQFTQDYSNAGRLIQMLADAPVLGKPFARFIPELLRLTKNNAVYNPLGMAAGFTAFSIVQNEMSKAMGETPEEREARETTVGQTLIPGTAWLNQMTGGPDRDISLNIPVNDTAVNVARAVGLNFPIEPGSDPQTALINQLLPFVNPTRKTADGELVFAPAELISSLAFRPVADQIANRDFMGREISDPENTVISEMGSGKSKFENPDGSRQSPGKDKELQNRATAAAMSYLPFANEVQTGIAGATGKEDYYGKERTPLEAIMRIMGLKAEKNDAETREKRVNTKDFFEGKDAQVKTFLRENPDAAESYFAFNDRSRDRNTNQKSSGLVTPERWSIVEGDPTGKLFEQLKREAVDASKADGKPVDPIFQLNDPARVKDVLFIRSTAPGDNIEKEEILRATSPWYTKFEKAEAAYYDANKAFFDKMPKSKDPADPNPRVQAYSEVPYPEQTDLIKQYYQAKAQGDQQGKDFFAANADKLSADFSGYKSKKLDYINKRREILGLDPIDPDTFNNVTFGYEDDERKVARDLYYKGIGGGGFGGGGSSPNALLQEGNFGRAKSPNTVKISAIKTVKINPRKRAGAKSVKIKRGKAV